MRDKVYLALLQKTLGISRNSLIRKLMKSFSAEEIWLGIAEKNGEFKDLISDDELEMLRKARKNDSPDKIEDQIFRLGAKLISIEEDDYPERLKNIYNPPLLLYVKGVIPQKNLSIGMVGARKASFYGKEMAERLAEELSRTDVQIISGMARGVDSCSHRGALKHGGSTIAVLGSGLDVIYPRENKALYAEIAESENGAVISEFPFATHPLRFNFPLRNRIISGLSDGVLVIEAGLKSGSLITAEFALEQGRDVFAVPGPVTNPLFHGAHKLLREGAALVETAADILREYGEQRLFDEKRSNVRLTDEEQRIFSILGYDEVSLEYILEKSEDSAENILSLLSIMEIRGLIKQQPGRKFIRLY